MSIVPVVVLCGVLYYFLNMENKRFPFSVLCRTSTGLRNTPPLGHGSRLYALGCALEKIEDAVRAAEFVTYGKKSRRLSVTSGYRSPEVNTKVGGSTTSDHVNGWAADILVTAMTPLALAKIVHTALGGHFDQLIVEPGWVHISIAPRGRSQVLIKTAGVLKEVKL